jgi:imidazolonepropionase-like amidohydrolase
MKNRIILSIFFLLNSALIAQTAFVNVNVIPMNEESVLENQIVIVDGDRIVAIANKDEVDIPEGAEIIEANGKYLIPGLADMHMHFATPGHEISVEENERPLKLYLANGVTTVRELSAGPLHFKWEKEIAAGTRMGPTIYKARLIETFPEQPDKIVWETGLTAIIGLVLFLIIWILFRKRIAQTGKRLLIYLSLFAVLFAMGYMLTRMVVPTYQPFGANVAIVNSAWEAREAVYEAKAAGYDLLKPYDALTTAQFSAMMDAAKETDMIVAGHIAEVHGLDGAIAYGQDEVVHLEELLNEFLINYEKGSYSLPFNLEIDESRIANIVKKLKDSNTKLCATMVVDDITYRKTSNPEEFIKDPIVKKYLYRYQLQAIKDETDRHLRIFNQAFPGNIERWYELYKKILPELRKAGVIVTLGTDAGVEGIVHGFTIHDELKLLVEIGGYSPFQAIAAGTKNAAESMNDLKEWGTIEVDKRADMVLLAENPLEDISRTRNPEGVMAQGKWYPKETLIKFLDELAYE